MARQKEPEFSIMIPAYDNSRRKIRPKHFKKYIDRLNNRFGGSTVTANTLGCFVNPDTKPPKVECEKNHKIRIARDWDSPFIKTIEDRAFEPRETATEPEKKAAMAWQRQIIEEDWDFVRKVARDIGEEFGQTGVFADFALLEEVSTIPGRRQEKLGDSKVFKNRKLPADVFKRTL